MISRHVCSFVAMLGIGLLSVFPAPVTVAAGAERPLSAMHKAFDALSFLLPLSLSLEAADDPDNRELLETKLAELSNASRELDAHAENRDSEFRAIARSFSAQVTAIRRAYANRRIEEIQFLLMDLTQNCVACHARLPSHAEYPFGQVLLARMNVDTMDKRDLAQLQLATRQFTAALATLDQVLADRAINPIDLDFDGTILEYLNVTITVLQDFARARGMLDVLERRPDLPYYMTRYVDTWRAAMDEVEADVQRGASLERARRLFFKAAEPAVDPGARRRVIHDLAAASILRRYLDDNAAGDGPDVAEAFYMLGVIELRTMDPRPAVPQMEFLLEAAIRAAPQGPFAKPAYALLEEYSHFSYWGPTISEPDDPVLRIDELRELIGIDE